MSVAYADEYWDGFTEEGLGEWIYVLNPKTRKRERKWREIKKTVLPKLRPRLVVVPQPTTPTTATAATGAILTQTGATNGVAVKPQSWYAKGLDAWLERERINAEVEKAKAAAGIIPGTIPTAGQQAAAMNSMNESAGSQVGGATASAFDWLGDNILVVGGVGLLVLLLFMNPPGRK